MKKACLFLNGAFETTHVEHAYPHPFDAAHIFGDGVYEVISVVNGKLFDLEPHLARLGKSLKTVLIPQPFSSEALAEALNKLLVDNDIGEKNNGFIYLQISRGVAEKRDFMFNANTTPSFFACYQEQVLFPQQSPAEGETSLIFPDIRWGMCHVKSIMLMPSRLAKKTAADNGASEPIFVNDKGIITEGGSSNIFIVKDGVLITHPADNAILWGITRERVIELAKKNGIQVQEKKFALAELLAADELFRTSTTMGARGISAIKIAPLPPEIFRDAPAMQIKAEIGSYKIGDGLVGRVTSKLSADYMNLAINSGKHAAKY